MIERKRTTKTKSIKPKITFMRGLKLWANQWRWSNIKMIWSTEYSRIHGSTTYKLDKINEKLR